MNAYTELKYKFDHLQKRTWELFEYGQKREGRLNGAMASVWHELGRISDLNNIDEIKDRLLTVRKYIGDICADNNALDEDAQKAGHPSA